MLTSFMVYLALDRDQIFSEMHRILQSGGIIGLAVQGEPISDPGKEPWTKARRVIDPACEPPKFDRSELDICR